jgi:Xaa-Pro aminopeptidase
MTRRILTAAVVAVVALLATTTFSAGALDKAEYAARRSRLMAQIGDGAAIFLGATEPASDVAFRQGHGFFYMTGVEIPDAILVIDGLRKESVLFFTMNETTADGLAIPIDLVRAKVAYTGIERAMPADGFAGHLAGLVNDDRKH